MTAQNEPSRPIHDRAVDNLRYIRDAMERASSFTAVPGLGGVGMGVIALVTAPLAAAQRADAGVWLSVWLGAAGLAAGVGAVTMSMKARRANASMRSGAGRRFVLGFATPVLVGAAMTFALARAGEYGLLPGVWLLMYGTAVVTSGAFSVPAVPVMGAGFLGVGLVALAFPAYGDVWMAAGFGGLQIGFGILIARRHGG